jgi:hypothetical protein
MSLLSDLNEVLMPIGIPIETGIFSGVPRGLVQPKYCL